MGWEARARARDASRSKSAEAENRPRVDEDPPDCPDFDLAPLTDFPPEVFGTIGDDDVDAFVLSLAFAYNDLKDFEWVAEQLKKCKPQRQEVSTHNGQWAGMTSFVNRHLLAHLHELLQAIETAHNNGLLEHAYFTKCVELLPRDAAESWASLVAVVRNQEAADPFRKFLLIVRNNLVSHFYQPGLLLKAYRRFFFEREPDQFNARAYASLGRNLEASRFYFADAAPVEYYKHMVDPSLFDEAGRRVNEVNAALRFLVQAYLELKAVNLREQQR